MSAKPDIVTPDKPMEEGEASVEPSKNNASPGKPSEENESVKPSEEVVTLEKPLEEGEASTEPSEDNAALEEPNEEEKVIHKLSEDRVALVQCNDFKLLQSSPFICC